MRWTAKRDALYGVVNAANSFYGTATTLAARLRFDLAPPIELLGPNLLLELQRLNDELNTILDDIDSSIVLASLCTAQSFQPELDALWEAVKNASMNRSDPSGDAVYAIRPAIGFFIAKSRKYLAFED